MTSKAHSQAHWIDHTPPGLFASVMGIAGLGLALRKAHEVTGMSGIPGEVLLFLAGLQFAALLVLYGLKVLRGSGQFRSDMVHPVRANFVPAITIGVLLLSTAALPYHRVAAEFLWIVGTAGHFILAIRLIRRWIGEPHNIMTMSAAWFIPVVGNIIVPITGVRLGYIETSWMLFSFGLLFWLMLFAIVLYRKMFHDPLPDKLMPTLAILIAPPAIGFVSYSALNGGEVDMFSRILFYNALVLTVVVVSLAPKLLRLPFALSWWAYTFPLDAFAIATLTFAHETGLPAMQLLASVALGMAAIINLWVAIKTIGAIRAGKVFVPE